MDDSTTDASAGSSPTPQNGYSIDVKFNTVGTESWGAYALLDNRPFADEPIDPDLCLLLKVVVYLWRLARSSVAHKIVRAHLALVSRKLKHLQFDRLRWEGKQWFSLEL